MSVVKSAEQDAIDTAIKAAVEQVDDVIVDPVQGKLEKAADVGTRVASTVSTARSVARRIVSALGDAGAQATSSLSEPQLPSFTSGADTRAATLGKQVWKDERFVERVGGLARNVGGGHGSSQVDLAFAWDNAAGPDGPWSHLRVVAVRGTEAIST